MSLKNQAIKSVKWTAVGSLVTTILQSVSLIVVARYVSPKEYGLMGMVLLIITFIQNYIDLGMGSAVIQKTDVSKNEHSTIFWLNIIVGFFLCLVLLSVADLLAQFFNEPELAGLVRFTSMILIISSFSIQFQMIMQKELMFDILSKIEITATIFSVSTVIILAILGFKVMALIWGVIINTTIKSILLYVFGWKFFQPQIHFNIEDLKYFIHFGIFRIGETMMFFAGEKIDQILVGTILGAQQLGYYNFALNLVMQPYNRINPLITRVAFPTFSKIQDQEELYKNAYLKFVRILTTINAPLLVGLAVTSPYLIPIIFGPKWNPSIVIIQILAFAGLIKTILNTIPGIYLSKGKINLGFIWTICIIIIGTPLVYLGGKYYLSVGVAYASVISQGLILVFTYFFIVQRIVGKCSREYILSIIKPVLMSVCMAGFVMFLLTVFRQGAVQIILPSSIVLGVIFYTASIYLFDRSTFIEVKNMY